MNEDQIELIINEMCSNNENREQAEEMYSKIVEESPFEMISYHIQFILNNLQDNNAIIRGLTLLRGILKNSEVYQIFTPEQNEFIQTKLLEMLLIPEFGENNRNHLLDIIDLAQLYYNRDGIIEGKEFGWPSIFEFSVEQSQSDDSIISTIGIELISRFIRCGTFKVEDNIELILGIIQKVLSTENKFYPQIISTIKLITESYFEEENMKTFSQAIIELIPEIPVEFIKQYIINIYLIQIDFFEDNLQLYINTIATLLASNEYPNDMKYYLFENIELFLKSTKKENLKNTELYMPIIESISTLFTLVESDDDFLLTKSGKFILYLMSKTFESNIFDQNCLELALSHIGDDNWVNRFSSLSIFDSISILLEEDVLIEKVQFFVYMISDPSDLCRKTVYKIMKRISISQKDVFVSDLHQLFYTAVLESIPKEENPEIFIYGLKCLSKFCENSGSEILNQHYESILKICSLHLNESSVELHTFIIECMKCLCKSMREHIFQSYQDIFQYMSTMASLNNPSISYSVVCCIPEICKIIPSKIQETVSPSKFELAQFGISLFVEIIEDESFSEQQRIDLFESFTSFIEIIGIGSEDLEKTFNGVVTSLMTFASEKIEIEIVDDDIDYTMLPKNMGIIRADNPSIKHKIIIFSKEKDNEIGDSFRNLDRLIELFPERFVPYSEDLLTIIVNASMQDLLNHIPVLNCMKTIMNNYQVMNIDPQHFLDVMNNISTKINTKEMISLMKFFLNLFKDNEYVQPLIDIANKILEILKNYQNELNERYIFIKDKPQCTEEVDSIADDYGHYKCNEYFVANFFSLLMENFPSLLSQEFVDFIHASFPNNQKNILPFLIVETRIQSLTTKDFGFIISKYNDYINYGALESLFYLDLISQIIQSENQENQESFLNIKSIILNILNDEDNEFLDNNPKITTKALYCLALLFANFPASIDEDSLASFTMFMPDDSKYCKLVNREFANQLSDKTNFFISDDNLINTLEIIAKSCDGHLIDEETRSIFRKFVKFVFEIENIEQKLDELDNIYAVRLQNFAFPSK